MSTGRIQPYLTYIVQQVLYSCKLVQCRSKYLVPTLYYKFLRITTLVSPPHVRLESTRHAMALSSTHHIHVLHERVRAKDVQPSVAGGRRPPARRVVRARRVGVPLPAHKMHVDRAGVLHALSSVGQDPLDVVMDDGLQSGEVGARVPMCGPFGLL